MVVAIPPPPRKQAARGNWVASVTAILLLVRASAALH